MPIIKGMIQMLICASILQIGKVFFKKNKKRYIINKEVRYMKLNKNGWGYRMMAFLMGLLIIAILVLFYLLYSYLDSVKGLELKTKNIEVVEKI